MGSSSYDRDVYSSSSYSSWGTSEVSSKILSRKKLDHSLEPKGRVIVSNSKTPIIIVLDVTGSNIEFAKLVYDKFPMFYGELESKGYIKDFDISICAVGDFTSDKYPLQISDFSKGIEIDSWLEKLVLEGNGGPFGEESYEMAAHYLLNNVEFREDANPMVFFIADEKPYDKVDKSFAEEIDIPIQENYDPWSQLAQKYKDNIFVMLNKACGRYFIDSITEKWQRILPPQHVVKINEEKAIIDLILGVISLQKDDIDSYAIDMLDRGQTRERIEGVTESLKELSNATALQRVDNIDTEMTLSLKPKKNNGKRL